MNYVKSVCWSVLERGTEWLMAGVWLLYWRYFWWRVTAHLCSVLPSRSQTDNEGNVTAEASTGGVSMESALYVKTAQPALEDLSGMSCGATFWLWSDEIRMGYSRFEVRSSLFREGFILLLFLMLQSLAVTVLLSALQQWEVGVSYPNTSCSSSAQRCAPDS